MSDTGAFGFGQFIPGFEFLQNLGKPDAAAGMPPFAHWVAPTLSVEDIDKRIEELKSVQFWLEQNNKALSATVQALQVQRMTLSTLKNMNVNVGQWAQGFPFAGQSSASATAPQAAASSFATWPMPQAATESAPAQPAAPSAQAPTDEAAAANAGSSPDPAAAAHMATAMQWWGALTQQFQHIAQQAMQDTAQQQAVWKGAQMTGEMAQAAVQTAGDMVRKAMAQVAPAAPAAGPRQSKKTAPAAAPQPEKPAAKKTVKKAATRTRTAVNKSAAADKKTPRAAAKPRSSAAKKAPSRR